MRGRWEREANERPAEVYELVYVADFGDGAHIGLRLRAGIETIRWAESFLASYAPIKHEPDVKLVCNG